MNMRVAASRAGAVAFKGHRDTAPLVRFQTNALMQVAP